MPFCVGREAFVRVACAGAARVEMRRGEVCDEGAGERRSNARSVVRLVREASLKGQGDLARVVEQTMGLRHSSTPASSDCALSPKRACPTTQADAAALLSRLERDVAGRQRYNQGRNEWKP